MQTWLKIFRTFWYVWITLSGPLTNRERETHTHTWEIHTCGWCCSDPTSSFSFSCTAKTFRWTLSSRQTTQQWTSVETHFIRVSFNLKNTIVKKILTWYPTPQAQMNNCLKYWILFPRHTAVLSVVCGPKPYSSHYSTTDTQYGPMIHAIFTKYPYNFSCEAKKSLLRNEILLFQI